VRLEVLVRLDSLASKERVASPVSLVVLVIRDLRVSWEVQARPVLLEHQAIQVVWDWKALLELLVLRVTVDLVDQQVHVHD